MHVVLVMDGPIDSLSASSVSRYHISRGIDTPQSVTVLRPLFNRLLLRLNQPLQPLQIYSLTVSGLRDCNGNPIETLLSVRLALGGPPDSLNLVVNEVLFNPPPEGSDFVELYNRGPYPADLSQLYLANRNAAGMVGSSTPLAAEPLVLFPGEHLALTEDFSWLRSRYRPPDSARLLTLPVLPSYNDDAGTVVLLNTSGSVLDEVSYHENWHFPLIRDREGISLERTGFSESSSESGNWHSASSSTGHATPGYRNSQYRSDEISGAVVEVTPKAITPDNDGQDDYLRIGYRFPESGFVATVSVFDAWGRPVRLLQRNALCGTAGYFVWNGLGEYGRDLAAGMYVVLTEVFHPAGKKRQFRNVVVVARQIR
jgi:hypothetical protein